MFQHSIYLLNVSPFAKIFFIESLYIFFFIQKNIVNIFNFCKTLTLLFYKKTHTTSKSARNYIESLWCKLKLFLLKQENFYQMQTFQFLLNTFSNIISIFKFTHLLRKIRPIFAIYIRYFYVKHFRVYFRATFVYAESTFAHTKTKVTSLNGAHETQTCQPSTAINLLKTLLYLQRRLKSAPIRPTSDPPLFSYTIRLRHRRKLVYPSHPLTKPPKPPRTTAAVRFI